MLSLLCYLNPFALFFTTLLCIELLLQGHSFLFIGTKWAMRHDLGLHLLMFAEPLASFRGDRDEHSICCMFHLPPVSLQRTVRRSSIPHRTRYHSNHRCLVPSVPNFDVFSSRGKKKKEKATQICCILSKVIVFFFFFKLLISFL